MLIRKVWILTLAGLLLGGCSSIPKVLGSQPMRFECRNLANYVHDYEHRGFAELQKDAYAPHDPRRLDTTVKGIQDLVDDIAFDSTAQESRPMRMLALSGGGQWGAYGAGFLDAMPADQKRFDVVTGISTGAIQSLFIGAGDYGLMRRLYGLEDIGNPAFSNRLNLVTRGSEHNIGPLREMLNHQLYRRGEVGLLHKIANGKDTPRIIIGLVEGFSTRLKVVDLTAYVRENYSAGDGPGEHEARTRLADCVAGVVLGSSSIPLRLTPVQIDYGHGKDDRYAMSTFMDGGVRLSVIDEFVEESAELAYAAAWCRKLDGGDCTVGNLQHEQQKTGFESPPKPQIFIVRNGPTIVPRGSLDTEIDRDPDAYVAALRGYSVLVNQNELASITELQSRNRYADLYFTSADGYDWIKRKDTPVSETYVCPPRDEKNYFDGNFMRCLRRYGAWKYKASQWQRLSFADEKDGILVTDGAPLVPHAAIVKRADGLLERKSYASEGGESNAR